MTRIAGFSRVKLISEIVVISEDANPVLMFCLVHVSVLLLHLMHEVIFCFRVEQELMARIISGMYGRRERESKVAEEHLKPVAEKEKEEEISVSSVNSEDSISVQNSINGRTLILKCHQ